MSLYLGESRIPIVKTGSAIGSDTAVLYTEQNLKQEQKNQARKNIEAASEERISQLEAENQELVLALADMYGGAI